MKTVKLKIKIIYKLRDFFLKPEFRCIKNTKTNLIGVANGVLEAVNSNIIFRENKPEDYITLYLNVRYIEDNNWEKESIRKFMELLNQNIF